MEDYRQLWCVDGGLVATDTLVCMSINVVQMMVALPTLHQPRKQLPRYVPRFHTAGSNTSPLGIVVGYFIVLISISSYQIVENFENKSEPGNTLSDDPAAGEVELVREAKKNVYEPQDYSYSERDVILYNLSIGATEQELHWTFENHQEFGALPTFGVVPQFMAGVGLPLDFLPNFNPVRSSCAFYLHPVVLGSVLMY